MADEETMPPHVRRLVGGRVAVWPCGRVAVWMQSGVLDVRWQWMLVAGKWVVTMGDTGRQWAAVANCKPVLGKAQSKSLVQRGTCASLWRVERVTSWKTRSEESVAGEICAWLSGIFPPPARLF